MKNSFTFKVYYWMVYSLGLKNANEHLIYALIYKESPIKIPRLKLTVKQLMDRTALSRPTVSKIVNKLIKKGLILPLEKATPEELKKLTLNINKKSEVCSWCECLTHTLQEHHFPIGQKDGGQDTIKICANCHASYHFYENLTNKL